MSEISDYLPSYASYNWTGAPADFSLATNTDSGGDSSMYFYPLVTATSSDPYLNRNRKFEQMVPIR